MSVFDGMKTAYVVQSFEQLVQHDPGCHSFWTLHQQGHLSREQTLELALLYMAQRAMMSESVAMTATMLRLPDPIINQLLVAIAPTLDEKSCCDSPRDSRLSGAVSLLLTTDELAALRRAQKLLEGLRDRDPFSFSPRKSPGGVPGRDPAPSAKGDHKSG